VNLQRADPAAGGSVPAEVTGEPGLPVASEKPAAKARLPRRGDELAVRIDSFDERGQGVGCVEGMRLRMKRAQPGELVRARVLRRRGAEIDALVVQRIEPSPQGTQPACAHYGSCGGCSFQDLAYSAQLSGLQALVEKAFAARGLLSGVAVEPVVPAADRWHYRNKMDFTFGNRRWIEPSEPPDAPADFALGLHAAQMHSKVIDVRSCTIQMPIADAILNSARRLALERRISPWDIRTHTGLLRHLVLRTARATGEVMVNLVTSSASPEIIDDYAAAIVAAHPQITTLVQNVTLRKSAVALGDWERVLHGPGVIHERLLGLSFAIAANSFFQTNTAQAEALFSIVREEASLSGSEVVFDLYCGTGSIALLLAGAARAVFGFELSPAAVADARRNAAENGIQNARFIEGDVLAGLSPQGTGWTEEGPRPAPDLCVVDPPRAGLHPRMLPSVVALAPRRIVYVSCNAAAAARDIEHFVRQGYEIARIRPIDLFPHTPHVECVIRLERRDIQPAEGTSTGAPGSAPGSSGHRPSRSLDPERA
jgi:23S rRNA (uracil1939-C5)-methyltransferase